MRWFAYLLLFQFNSCPKQECFTDYMKKAEAQCNTDANETMKSCFLTESLDYCEKVSMRVFAVCDDAAFERAKNLPECD